MCEQQAFLKKQKMSCIVCGKLYSSKHFLQKHILIHKLCPVVEQTVMPETTCGYCGTQFGANSRVYIEHMTQVAKNLKRLKTTNTEEAAAPLAKLSKLEEEDMEIENNVV